MSGRTRITHGGSRPEEKKWLWSAAVTTTNNHTNVNTYKRRKWNEWQPKRTQRILNWKQITSFAILNKSQLDFHPQHVLVLSCLTSKLRTHGEHSPKFPTRISLREASVKVFAWTFTPEWSACQTMQKSGGKKTRRISKTKQISCLSFLSQKKSKKKPLLRQNIFFVMSAWVWTWWWLCVGDSKGYKMRKSFNSYPKNKVPKY